MDAVIAELDVTALWAAGIILALGLVLALGLKWTGIQDGVTFIALMVLPLVVYGVASGMVAEFSAPGGWGAKFRDVAGNAVDPAPLEADAEAEFERLSIVEKRGMSALEAHRATLEPGEPVAMTLVLGRSGYTPQASARYARVLLSVDPGLTVIFVDAEGRFVASASGASMLAALENEEQGWELIEAIGAGDIARVEEHVGLTTESLEAGTTNAEALEAMLGIGASSLVVVDESERPVGVIRREDIVAKMLVKLAAP